MIHTKNHPTEAIIAVTLNCNARCVMCNIWQNKIPNEVKPDFYKKLPSSLREINVTGGEPFLRPDLPEIIKVMKKTCPKARLLINTNGYLVGQIKKLAPEILKHDPNIAIRISLDGFGHTHTKIRGLPQFFEKAMESLQYLRSIGIKDLGISYTLMEQNKHELLKLYNYCDTHDFEFSLTVATDSPIYFGTGKVVLRPKIDKQLQSIFKQLSKQEYDKNSPKHWVRAWFDQKLLRYIESNVRYFPCSAGKDFFYLDSVGRVYACHLKPWLMGNLHEQTFKKIFSAKRSDLFRKKASVCNDCWMVCSVRPSIKKRLLTVMKEIFAEKLKSIFN